MVDWFEDDFVGFFEDNFYIQDHHGIPMIHSTNPSVWADGFTAAWDGMIDGLNDALEWTETAWDTATTSIEETFWDTVCDIEEDLLNVAPRRWSCVPLFTIAIPLMPYPTRPSTLSLA